MRREGRGWRTEAVGMNTERERWMENREEATDVGDAGVAEAVGDERRWQMHYQRRLHPR